MSSKVLNTMDMVLPVIEPPVTCPPWMLLFEMTDELPEQVTPPTMVLPEMVHWSPAVIPSPMLLPVKVQLDPAVTLSLIWLLVNVARLPTVMLSMLSFVITEESPTVMLPEMVS